MITLPAGFDFEALALDLVKILPLANYCLRVLKRYEPNCPVGFHVSYVSGRWGTTVSGEGPDLVTAWTCFLSRLLTDWRCFSGGLEHPTILERQEGFEALFRKHFGDQAEVLEAILKEAREPPKPWTPGPEDEDEPGVYE